MEGLYLSIATTSSTSPNACKFRSRISSFSNFRNYRTKLSRLPRKPRIKFLVFAASGNESEVRKWVSVELEWGSLNGEDPELSLAKRVGRKSYPELTDLELRELYEKKGETAFPEVDEIPFNLSKIRRKPSVKNKDRPINSELVRKPVSCIFENKEEVSQEDQAVVNNGILENNRILPLQKPVEIVNIELNDDPKLDNSAKAMPTNNSIQSGTSTTISLLQKPEIVNLDLNDDPKQESGGQRQSNSGISMGTVDERNINLDQSLERWDTLILRDYSASLQGEPKNSNNAIEHENFSAKPPMKEREDRDWARVEDLIKEGGRKEVELISASTGGFVVSFGSLFGFLPYRNVETRWRYLSFESWLRKNGLDPSKYKQYLEIVGKHETAKLKTSLDSSVNSKAAKKVNVASRISPDMKLDDLLLIYGQEKLKYSSSFVGQKFKLYVVLADRESGKLIFSAKQKEWEEATERKKKLMAKLSVGDVVKCCITKITYIGIYVSVEGAPALIHLTELPSDDILDLSSNFKRGQSLDTISRFVPNRMREFADLGTEVIDAKVIQLDFSRAHIYLSLKEIT